MYNYEGTGKTLFKAAKFNERRRAQKFFIQSARTHLIPLINAKTGVIAIPSRYKFLFKLLKVCVPKEQLFSDVLQIKQKPFSKVANKTLSAAGRYARVYENLQWNTLSWRKQKFERYLLCDDVSTSGATLERAAYLLKAHLDLKDEQILFWALMYRPRLPLEETTS
ncbi:MAG TPA: hypothetical protein PLY93_10650 [Turneriella sp.]|nr:hypothetical protein [Turneriella sp.]